MILYQWGGPLRRFGNSALRRAQRLLHTQRLDDVVKAKKADRYLQNRPPEMEFAQKALWDAEGKKRNYITNYMQTNYPGLEWDGDSFNKAWKAGEEVWESQVNLGLLPDTRKLAGAADEDTWRKSMQERWFFDPTDIDPEPMIPSRWSKQVTTPELELNPGKKSFGGNQILKNNDFIPSLNRRGGKL